MEKVSIRIVERRLREAGFTEGRAGKHRRFHHPTGKVVQLPHTPHGDKLYGHWGVRLLRELDEFAVDY